MSPRSNVTLLDFNITIDEKELVQHPYNLFGNVLFLSLEMNAFLFLFART